MGLGGAGMSSTHEQLAVLKLARARGLDPARLGRAQMLQLALEAQGSLGRQAAAATRALGSVAKTALGFHVSRERARANEQVCRKCPHGGFSILRDGTIACGECGCQGPFLESKWMDRQEFCPVTVSGRRVHDVGFLPEDPPTWSNVEAPDA